GMVCDIAAFAASTWMRGCGLVLVPTTVLAQVDAAIGGKTAINYGGIKNLVGSFYPAQTVLITPEVLTTLPDELLVEGFAELLKHGVIADRDLFDTINTHLTNGPLLECITAHIERAIAIKTTIVSADPTEQGPRMLLNFGHTLGHAIESATGLRHGRAVAIGMVAAAEVSVAQGLLAATESAQLRHVLTAAHLPTTMAQANVTASRADLIAAMRHDKKTHGDTVSVVLLDRLGSARVVAYPYSIFEELVDAVA
ncbi:MAG: 3-dehydroquinate synthase, partial [Propionibacteriaceae bacterium]